MAGAARAEHLVNGGQGDNVADAIRRKLKALAGLFTRQCNVDAFNAFNIQGLRNPDSNDGIQSLQNSYWTPRQVQMTMRLSF